MSQQVSNSNLDEDLSVTLIERRKRLHELATEINQWEDESNKNIPVAPPMSQDLLNVSSSINRTLNSSKLNMSSNTSPFGRRFANSNESGIAAKIQKKNPIENSFRNNNTTLDISVADKENSTMINNDTTMTISPAVVNKDMLKKTSLNSAAVRNKNDTSATASAAEFSQVEMLNVAKKIQAKREQAQQQELDKENNTQKVRAIKEKFENIINKSTSEQSVNEDVHMTPRLLIKKFEAMSKDGVNTANAQAQHQPVPTSASKPCQLKTSARATSFLSNVDSAIQSSPISNSTKIIDLTRSSEKKYAKMQIAPKYDSNIEFIDSTDTTQLTNSMNSDMNDYTTEVTEDDIDDELTDSDDDDEQEDDDDDDESYDRDRTLTPKRIVEKFESLSKENAVAAVHTKLNRNSNQRESQEECGKFSLTYVSSMTTGLGGKESDVYESGSVSASITKQHRNHDNDDEPVYEELNSTNQSSSIDEIYMKKQEVIKNFRIDMDELDEGDEDDDDDDEEEEFDEIDEEDVTSYDRNSQDTSKFTTGSEYTTGSLVSRTESLDTISQYSDTYSLSSYGSESNHDIAASAAAVEQQQRKSSNKVIDDAAGKDGEGIYSIKDYRRQKKTGTGRSVRRSVLPGASSQLHDAVDNKKKLNLIEEKTKGGNQNSNSSLLDRVKELEDLIKQEDNIISQTGSALEQCFQDSQFTFSIEHIECNRLLLIACQKRQSYLTEISRLKQKIATNKNNKEEEIPEDLSGTLVFSDIQLPIKESYMNKLRNGDEKRIFHFICLIRHGIQVLQTQVISVQELLQSKDTIITFPNRMAISNVDVNFKVKIDVYAMETNPKEKQKKSPTKIDPKKFFSPFKTNVFHSHSHDSNYGHSSSGGFATVKTSNFIHIDTIEITHKDITRENFKLNISSSSIPLIGVLHIEVRCMPSKSIELRGFLTMFEDVSGYGAWDRRWFMLSNNSLSFWKYPEDEFRKSPLGSINLIECTTDKAQMLSRDICARKYTFELICVKAREKSEESDDSLISKSYDKYKFTKYWLSADTRDSANDWINHINWALTNLRLWNPNAVKPIKKSTN